MHATNGDNAINYDAGNIDPVANGLISVDGFETIEFSNKGVLELNAGSGSDSININNDETPTGLTSITVSGGDPTDGDSPQAWVSQEHDLGRISFFDPDEGTLETITGFELNSEIERE